MQERDAEGELWRGDTDLPYTLLSMPLGANQHENSLGLCSRSFSGGPMEA